LVFILGLMLDAWHVSKPHEFTIHICQHSTVGCWFYVFLLLLLLPPPFLSR